MQQNPRLKNTVLLMALAAVYPMQAHALAGIAQFTAGEVNVRQADGRVSALTKGGDVASGHAIVTGGNGRAQVKFTDGGLISLQPNTEFKISNYVDQNDPKQDRFLVDLLRGSMRAITGLIGKRNRDNYKLTTTTATIGIRGSGFKVGYNADGTVGITAELDKIEVCNQSGCTGLVAGESVRVISSTTPPVRTSEQAKITTPPTEKEPTVIGDKVSESGKAEIVVRVTPAPAPESASAPVPAPSTAPSPSPSPSTAPAPAPAPNTGSFTNLSVVTNYGATASTTAFPLESPPTTTELTDGKLTSFANPSATFKPVNAGAASSVGTVAAGDFVGWGVWVTGTGTAIPSGAIAPANGLHYVVGVPTAVMPTSGIATYSLIGSTAPTRYDGIVGSLTSASFSADFSFGYISTSLVTSFGTVGVSLMGVNGSSFSDGTSIYGNFFGANAARAGLVYGGFNAGMSFSGSAVFQKQLLPF